MRSLPEGTVTFLFSDIVGSTALLEKHGARMGAALARHHALFEEVVERHYGTIFETVGDAVYAAFGRPVDAVIASVAIQRQLRLEDWGPIGSLTVRIAVHTGHVERRGSHYFGPALFRAARLLSLGHGEQVLLSGVTASLVDELPDGGSLRDLGVHRLKDLGEPEHVHEVRHPELPSDHPPLAGLDAHPHNLPTQLSSFVGRRAELAALGSTLREHRLVTLLGPPGIGKTRLALQAAADRVDAYRDGAFFVDLATAQNTESMIGAMATAVGVRAHPGLPIELTLRQHLATRELLLLLDNMEHLLPVGADVVADLFAGAPELRVLTTSRAPLRIRGEHEFHVPSLAAGEPSVLDDELPDAVGLFVERVRSIDPSFEVDGRTGPVIAAICRRLEGLPLAIELAAARMRMFGLEALLERLTSRLGLLSSGARDLPERQRTLRGAIAWSEELLQPAERAAFRRLGVFVGGFTLASAEAVAGDDAGADLLDALDHLVEHSLVRRADGVGAEERFAMLETVREFALERLRAESEEDTVRDRHLAHFVGLVERAYDDLQISTSNWVPGFDADQANIRAALDWSAPRDARANATLISAVALHWYGRGLVTEVQDRLTSALQRYSARDTTRARALVHAGEIAFRAGGAHRADAPALLREALEISDEVGDVRGQAHALEVIGMGRIYMGRSDDARDALERSRALREDAGVSEVELAGSLAGLCLLAISLGDSRSAEPLAQRIHDLGVRHESVRLVQQGLHYLADCRLLRGEYAEAVVAYGRALRHAHVRGLLPHAANELIGVAMALAASGEHERAIEVAATANARRAALGMHRPYIEWWDRLQDRHLGDARRSLAPESSERAERRGLAAAFDEVVTEVVERASAPGSGEPGLT